MYGRLDQMTHVYCSIDPKENFYIPFVVSLYLNGEIQMMKVDQFVKNRPKKVQKGQKLHFSLQLHKSCPMNRDLFWLVIFLCQYDDFMSWEHKNLDFWSKSPGGLLHWLPKAKHRSVLKCAKKYFFSQFSTNRSTFIHRISPTRYSETLKSIWKFSLRSILQHTWAIWSNISYI